MACVVCRYESANQLDESFKMFNAHLPVAHTIFLHSQPKLISNQTKPHLSGISRLAERILEANAKFNRGKSGLVLAEIYSLNLNVARFAQLSGSAWSPLPKFLQIKKAVLNIKNEDDRSFGYAIAAALHSQEINNNLPRRELYLQYFVQHGLNEIDYLVSPLDIPHLEKHLNLSINVFIYFDDIGKARQPMYISQQNVGVNQLTLLQKALCVD